jgi:glutamate synthase domain-containing protein 2/glutamate synthase domain-containing protein 1/glutamate synthase domain-containing protein 3
VTDREGRASRDIVETALSALACMTHRGAVAADALTADGSGVLLGIPRAIFGEGPDGVPHGVASLFVRGDDPRPAVEAAAAEEGIEVVGWRTPPTDEEHLGVLAQDSRPEFLQAILETPQPDERAAYRLRRRIEATAGGTYVASCSFHTVAYKGLVAARLLSRYYLDLADERYVSPLVVFHQRFSTNTLPTWERAQPFRTLCHNGEINAIAGNQNRMRARARLGTEEAGLGPEALFRPLLDETEPDSGRLDSAVEVLVRGGRDIRHAVAMLVPEAWEGERDLDAAVLGFYRYHACLVEPWDGPAGLIFTDGTGVGAALDRNGLRPLRYTICEDGMVACCSEAGAVDLTGRGEVRRGRLGPGQMIFVDPGRGVYLDGDCKAGLAAKAPYARWAADGLIQVGPSRPVEDTPPTEELERRQIAHGYTVEEMRMVIKPMAADAKEPIFSMGDDTPLPNWAGRPRPIHHFLKQRFAQVTNPAIDHLRERLVMSLRTLIGPRSALLSERPEAAHLVELPSFFLTPSTLEQLRGPAAAPFRPAELDATFLVDAGAAGLQEAVERLQDEAARLVAGGSGLLVITQDGVSAERAPIPSLLATGAVHHRLVSEGRRAATSLLVVADDARDTHNMACLLGYGADAVCPRLALQSVAADADASEEGGAVSAAAQENYQAAVEDGVLKIMSKMGISTVDSYRGAQIFEIVGLAAEVVQTSFAGTPSPVGGLGWRALGEDALARHAESGLADAVGVAANGDGAASSDREAKLQAAREAKAARQANGDGGGEAESKEARAERLAARAKAAREAKAARQAEGTTTARIPPRAGPTGNDTGDDTASDNGDDDSDEDGERPQRGGRRGARSRLENPGYYRDLKRGGEYHAHNKDVVDALNGMTAAHLLQQAIRGDREDIYLKFAELVHGRPPTELRDLLELVSIGPAIPVDEVEPAAEIAKRFSTGAMSHGSLSAEAHETLAEAMNLIGGRSNCGEGGEDPFRYLTRGQPSGDKNSRIKQIASGRFGVTPQYCAYADELQIKIAQGSKPGEGGQLPGHKVSEEIARLRHTQPGVSLISPPPHHDIYSIEDLAQLIFDLKQVNRHADVSVKLVACDGVGTVAAGVVKALADVVQVSGCNGGTGASPLSSIKHAGMPWETGLAETQSVLIENGLRDRVRLRVDGGFMTGRDVLIAALLGADEYSFGTAAMLAEGCIMLRACHRDTCSTGIATQRSNLRAKFAGTPEGVAAYLLFVAQEARTLMASIGLRSFDEAIGRVECLRQRSTGDERVDTVDLGPLLVPPTDTAAPRRFVATAPIQRPRSQLGDRLEADAFRTVWEGRDIELSYPITNGDRAVGASLGGTIALEWGGRAPLGTAVVQFEGAAGQSFGAFLTHGIELELVGEANDYVGKAMGGGRIVIRPPGNDAGDPVLAGNTCLYGATDGWVFIAGSAGERFAVRNSGATAVVEGAGDHACEYMTGGTVVILGPVGYNLGAGMTGGAAYVWDPRALLPARLNTALVAIGRPDSQHVDELRWLVERHHELTGSTRAASLLGKWSAFTDQVWLVAPVDRIAGITTQQAGRVAASA